MKRQPFGLGLTATEKRQRALNQKDLAIFAPRAQVVLYIAKIMWVVAIITASKIHRMNFVNSSLPQSHRGGFET